MADSFHCGDNGALVAYLYDECDPGERAAIAAHLAVCSTCAAEVATLGATRQQLSAWAPPEAQLDFRLTAGVSPAARWWSNPLPAWAQLAAAVVIFAFGIALGTVFTRTPAWATTPSPANDLAIAQTELKRLDQRVRNIESKSPVPVAMDDATREAMATFVRQEIYESELRNRRLFSQAISNVNGDRPQDVMQGNPGGFGPVEIGARFGQRRQE
jgi:hypothetical protein